MGCAPHLRGGTVLQSAWVLPGAIPSSPLPTATAVLVTDFRVKTGPHTFSLASHGQLTYHIPRVILHNIVVLGKEHPGKEPKEPTLSSSRKYQQDIKKKWEGEPGAHMGQYPFSIICFFLRIRFEWWTFLISLGELKAHGNYFQIKVTYFVNMIIRVICICCI